MRRKLILPMLAVLFAVTLVAIGATVPAQLQTFNAGELSPLMKARSDYPKYGSGAQTLQNMMVRSQGPVQRRPGTRFVAEVKDSNDPVRLIPFEYSTEDTYVIELGDDYARFYRAGAPIGAPYEIATPWDANDLFELQFAQNAQYMRVVHPDYPPYKLTRTAHTSWTATEISFQDGPFIEENDDPNWTLTPSAVTGAITIAASDDTFVAGHVGALWRLTHPVDANTISGTFTSNGWRAFGETVTNGSSVAEQLSATLAVADGQDYTVTTTGHWYGILFIQKSYDDGVTWRNVFSQTGNGETNIQFSGTETLDDAIYRLRMQDHWGVRYHKDEKYYSFTYDLVGLDWERQGIVEITAVNGARDANATVIYDLGDTSATYKWAEGYWSTYRGFPRTVEFYEERCVYGGSDSFPQTVWASVTSEIDDDYDDFDAGTAQDDDAWTYVLPGMNPLQWLKAQQYLMLGTSAAIGRLGTEAKELTPTSTEYKIQAKTGCAYMQPVQAMDALLFVERGNRNVREIQYTYTTETFTAADMTILAEHITDPCIVEIDWQERPDPVLYCVRGDGQLLTFTYNKQHEVQAWARHVTGQDVNDWTIWDEFESVVVIPGSSDKASGDERTDDEVWVVVKRTIDSNDYRYVEQFQSLDWGSDPNYCWFVDCALSGSTQSGNDGLTQGVNTVSTTYTYVWINENSGLYGVPLGDAALLSSLDNGGSALNVGGGVVGLPFADHPYAAGQQVIIAGTTNYNGTFTLTGSTTTDVLHITDTYDAETFDGTETVVRNYPFGTASTGRMVGDSDGDLWVGHNWNVGRETVVTRIDPVSGAFTSDDLIWSPAPGVSSTVVGLEFTDDESALYVQTKVLTAILYKFNVATGAASWTKSLTYGTGFDIAVDDSDNVYTAAYANRTIAKFAAADGTASAMTNMGYTGNPNIVENVGNAVETDDVLGIVIAGHRMYCLTAAGQAVIDTMYNFSVRTFDNSKGDTLLLGSNWVAGSITNTAIVSTKAIAVDETNGVIYVLTEGGSHRLHKVTWDGTSLTEVASAAGPTYAAGIYLDLYDNLVVINQSNTGSQTDVFHFYDSNLAAVDTVDNFERGFLGSWQSGAGNIYQKGGVVFNGSLGDYGGIIDTTEWSGFDVTNMGGVSQCVYADGRPVGNFEPDVNGVISLGAEYSVVIAGLNYFSILETMPLTTAEASGLKTQVTNVKLDFHESMGANLGATYADSTELHFSDDDFATAMAPWSGIKVATFPRGVSREPVLYLWEWDPIPMSIRALRPTMNVFTE